MATVLFKGYIDKAAFEDGKEPISNYGAGIEGDEFLSFAAVMEGISPQEPLSKMIYDYAKTKIDLFKGSTDIG